MSIKKYALIAKDKAFILLECYKILFRKLMHNFITIVVLFVLTILSPFLSTKDLDELCFIVWESIIKDKWF